MVIGRGDEDWHGEKLEKFVQVFRVWEGGDPKQEKREGLDVRDI